MHTEDAHNRSIKTVIQTYAALPKKETAEIQIRAKRIHQLVIEEKLGGMSLSDAQRSLQVKLATAKAATWYLPFTPESYRFFKDDRSSTAFTKAMLPIVLTSSPP